MLFSWGYVKTEKVLYCLNRNTSKSLGERQMLWELELQASVSTGFSCFLRWVQVDFFSRAPDRNNSVRFGNRRHPARKRYNRHRKLRMEIIWHPGLVTKRFTLLFDEWTNIAFTTTAFSILLGFPSVFSSRKRRDVKKVKLFNPYWLISLSSFLNWTELNWKGFLSYYCLEN